MTDTTPDVREALLRRLLQWDHFDAAADGSFWRREIQAALAASTPKAQRAEGWPELFDGMVQIPCAVMMNPGHPQNGWLFIPHADNKWVSLVKLDAFSGKIIEYWLAAAQPPKEAM